MDCSYDYCLISVEIQLREVQVHCFLHITVRGYINQCFLSYDHFWHSFYCTYYMMGLVVFSACYQYLSLSYCCCLHGHSCITASQCDNCLTISYLQRHCDLIRLASFVTVTAFSCGVLVIHTSDQKENLNVDIFVTGHVKEIPDDILHRHHLQKVLVYSKILQLISLTLNFQNLSFNLVQARRLRCPFQTHLQHTHQHHPVLMKLDSPWVLNSQISYYHYLMQISLMLHSNFNF